MARKIAKKGYEMEDEVFLEVARAFKIAQLVAVKGDEVLTDMVANMWNQEFSSEQEKFDNWVTTVNIFGYDEVAKRLPLRGISLEDNFTTYYQLIK